MTRLLILGAILLGCGAFLLPSPVSANDDDDDDCLWGYGIGRANQTYTVRQGYDSWHEARDALKERVIFEEEQGFSLIVFTAFFCGDTQIWFDLWAEEYPLLNITEETRRTLGRYVDRPPTDPEEIIAAALAKLPDNWGLDRDDIRIIDCSEGADSRGWNAIEWSYCRKGYGGLAYFEVSGGIVLNAASPEAWEYIIIHEAVHIAHADYCDRITRHRGPPRPLVLDLWRLYKEYQGPRASHEYACIHSPFNWANSAAAIIERYNSLPYDNRPVGSYALSNFLEYMAETITHGILGLLEHSSDPRAYEAFVEHWPATEDE